MKPLYWWLIGFGVVALGVLKLTLFQRWMVARQKRQDMVE